MHVFSTFSTTLMLWFTIYRVAEDIESNNRNLMKAFAQALKQNVIAEFMAYPIDFWKNFLVLAIFIFSNFVIMSLYFKLLQSNIKMSENDYGSFLLKEINLIRKSLSMEPITGNEERFRPQRKRGYSD